MKIEGIQINADYTGLCNQLIQFFHGVMECICSGTDVIVVGDFKKDLYKGLYCPFEDISNLDAFCQYLREHYGVVIVGKNQLDIKIKKVIFGTMTSFVDITDEFQETFLVENRLHVPCNLALNSLKGDPAYMKRKSIRIVYQIKEDVEIEKHYTEECIHLLNIDLKDIKYQQHSHWARQIHWMETLVKQFKFHPSFYTQQLTFDTTQVTPQDTVNIIHVRLEYDGIRHWAKENGLPEADFYNLLSQKYIDAITNHIYTGLILVLSHNSDNNVVGWLKDTHRPFIFVEKDHSQGREYNAICDMVLCEKYGNGVFIGSFDIYRMQGSTYSYFLMKRCAFQKNILIDIERIHEEPFISMNSSV